MDGYDLAGLIFAREVSGPLTSLVKQMDRQLGEVIARRPKHNNPGVFIVFCNDDPNLKKQLQELIAREGISHVVLCTFSAAGPRRYDVAKEADLTVLVWENNETVKVNIPLRRGELDEGKIRTITTALSRVLPR